MNHGVTMAVFEGGGNPASDIEKLLAKVRSAVLLDNLQKMMGGIDAVHDIILVTNYPTCIPTNQRWIR